uniref:C1q domain-containing protein n=1 Tax=Strigamia maritima TaxID=126957 RepID=T1JL30_STRMM
MHFIRIAVFSCIVYTNAIMSQPPPVGGGTFTGTYGSPTVVAFSYNRGFVTNANSNMRYIRYQNELTNVNADFRAEYGTFVCQQPGIYFFAFSALSNAVDDYRIVLKRNFDSVATIYASKLDYTMSTQTAILNLKRGDIVYLQVEEGSIFESSVQSRAYASFSGYIIAAGEYNRGNLHQQNHFSNQGNNQQQPPMLSFDSDGISMNTDVWKLLGLQRSA